jgi:hypothetical protein
VLYEDEKMSYEISKFIHMTGAINQIFNPSLYKKFKLKFIELRQDPYFVPCGSKASMIRKADALQ